MGTAAYQTYPCLVGAHLPSTAVMTNDADLLVSSFVSDDEPQDLEQILKRADPTFKAVMSNDDKLPKVFKSRSNFQVDILTQFGRGRKSPVIVEDLLCSAEALKFMEFLAGDRIDAVALYGAGVLVSVPPPMRYAIHKLLIAPERKTNLVKRSKDLEQAKDLISVFLETECEAFEEMLEEARTRGASWRRNIDASLREIMAKDRRGSLPMSVRRLTSVKSR